MRNVLTNEIKQFVRFKKKKSSEHANNRKDCMNSNLVIFKRSEHETLMEIDEDNDDADDEDEVVNTKNKSFFFT